ADGDPAVSPIEVSIVMPCLNEAETVGVCVIKAIQTLRELHVSGEVIVVDNGFSDESGEIAQAAGARVVVELARGYGCALRRGIVESRGDFVIMADADDSYDLCDLERFIEGLRSGCDLVMGSRFKGRIE